MKYNGIELKDIADTPQLINPPREMLVWDDRDLNPLTRLVFAITANENKKVRVIAEYVDGICERFGHCAEIPEEPKPRRATNRELAKWLAQGNGDYTTDITVIGYVSVLFTYWRKQEDGFPPDNLRIRKWDDTDWHEPDVQYMGLEA